MNRDDVIAALDQVLEGEIYKAAAERNPNEGMPIRMLSEPIVALLKAQDEFKDGAQLMIQLIDASVGFQADDAASLLLRRARDLGSSAAAVDSLEKILGTTEAPGLCIMALQGLAIERRVDLPSGVSIWPFDELPASEQKKSLQEPVGTNAGVHPSMWWVPREPPQAALVCQTTIKPFLVKLVEGADPPGITDSMRRMQLLGRVRLCLTCIGPCTPISAAAWFQFADEDLQAAVPIITHHQYTEVMPMKLREHGPFDPAAASAAVSAYLELKDGLQRKVSIALARLNQAMRRGDTGDAAVDLAIAFEALLGSGGKYKVGLRAALLLGGDPKALLNNRLIASGIFDLRNDLVHRGTISSKERKLPSGEDVTPSDLVDRGTVVCAAVVRRVLERRDLPDWYQFELSGGV